MGTFYPSSADWRLGPNLGFSATIDKQGLIDLRYTSRYIGRSIWLGNAQNRLLTALSRPQQPGIAGSSTVHHSKYPMPLNGYPTPQII